MIFSFTQIAPAKTKGFFNRRKTEKSRGAINWQIFGILNQRRLVRIRGSHPIRIFNRRKRSKQSLKISNLEHPMSGTLPSGGNTGLECFRISVD